MGTRAHISPRTSSWHASWEVLITNQTFLAGTSAVYRGVDWSWCQGRGKWWCWCWVGRCWCWGGGCWGGRPMRPERRHTLCASLSSRNAFQHVTRAASYGNLQVTRRRPEWGAPRSGTCLYTYRKNPSVWTNCLGNQKTDCNCLPACHFWTSGLVAGPGTRAPGHTGTRAHGHPGTTPIHGHTGTRAQPRSTGTRAHGQSPPEDQPPGYMPPEIPGVTAPSKGHLLCDRSLLVKVILVHLCKGQNLSHILKSCLVQAIAMHLPDKEFEPVRPQRKHCRSKRIIIK